MPTWDPKANDIFLQAIEITTPEERGRFLDTACAGDSTVRARVEALIRAHEGAGSFLGRPALEPTGEVASSGDDTRTAPAAAEDNAPLDFLAASDKPNSLGLLGHYEVQEVIGRGGMGIVLKAFDENLHRVVAIKVMAPQLAVLATARQRFAREARAQAAIAHEHVVAIHAVEEANGLPYIAMHYVAGASLQDRLDRDGPLRLTEVLRVGVQAAQGLAAAHKQGLVHRDVKPANILLENGVERVKLTDFGLARAADDASLTASGQVAGTPMYMSPEQAEGKPVDARSDLFSLGSVLYAMCTGRPPFRAGSSVAVLKRVCEDTPTPVREVNPEVPEWLADVIAKLHAKNPAQRFQGAEEVADLLGGYLAQVQRPTGAVMKPSALPARRRRRWAIPAAVLALLAAVLATTEATGVMRLRAAVARAFAPTAPSVAEGDTGTPQPQSGPGLVKPAGETAQPTVPVVGSGPFVILGRGSAADRAFSTLAEAVQATADGDIIEVRGDGPFVSAGIPPIAGRRLAIRAGAGARPVLRWNGEGGSEIWPSRPALLGTYDELAVEGLEFQAAPSLPPKLGGSLIQATNGGTVWATNCCFRSLSVDRSGNQSLSGIRAWEANCVVRNSSFLGAWTGGAVFTAMGVRAPGRRTLVAENCLFAAPYYACLFVTSFNHPKQSCPILLTNNTFAGGPIRVTWTRSLLKLAETPEVKLYDFESSGNVFAFPWLFTVNTAGDPDVLREIQQIQQPADGERVLRSLISWREKANVYGEEFDFYFGWGKNNLRYTSGMKLKQWAVYCGAPAVDSLQGRVRLRGGDVATRSYNDPSTLTEADFRLADDSTGKGARKGDGDLGADVDLVGPGAAYEKWKKTPAYQQWLRDSGQQK